MTIEWQLELWLAGNSVHNKVRDECCPDFSCCNPELLAPQDVRAKFCKAYLEKDDTTTHGFLMHFLGAMIAANSDEPVYIAGQGVKH